MRYVAVFAFSASLAEFCVEDLLSAAETLKVPLTPVNDQVSWLRPCGAENQFYLFDSPAPRPALLALAERCILLRGLYVLLQACPSLDALYRRRETIDASGKDAHDKRTMVLGESEQDFAEGDFCYQVETIGKKYTGDMKKEIIDGVLTSSPLPTPQRTGRVNYTTPHHRFYVFVQHQLQEAPPGAKGFASDGPVVAVIHATLLTESGRSTLLGRYDLRWRPYIGTTSMPAEEALLMANAARVSRGGLVMDPFCGTGSLLVAAAHHDAHTLGSDADGRAMRSGTEKGKHSPQLQLQRQLAMQHYGTSALALAGISEREQALPSMLTNFKAYHLPPPDRMRLNFAAWARTWHARGGFLDAIITDPPYGLREPRKKTTIASTAASAKGGGDDEAVRTTGTTVHTTSYQTNEVVLDLVMFAAEYLVVGGFLVFWHPTTDHFTPDELPAHPSLTLLSYTPQRLSLKVVRRLVVMVKTAEPPSPRPPRAACAPKQLTDDLRTLMDVTEMPDNPNYMHYRQRVVKRREATAQYLDNTQRQQESAPAKSSSSLPDEADVADDNAPTSSTEQQACPVRGRRRLETQRYIVDNRTRKLKLREEKQKASHEENLRRQQQLNASAKPASGNDDNPASSADASSPTQ